MRSGFVPEKFRGHSLLIDCYVTECVKPQIPNSFEAELGHRTMGKDAKQTWKSTNNLMYLN